jgi:hypothetical protein
MKILISKWKGRQAFCWLVLRRKDGGGEGGGEGA